MYKVEFKKLQNLIGLEAKFYIKLVEVIEFEKKDLLFKLKCHFGGKKSCNY